MIDGEIKDTLARRVCGWMPQKRRASGVGAGVGRSEMTERRQQPPRPSMLQKHAPPHAGGLCVHNDVSLWPVYMAYAVHRSSMPLPDQRSSSPCTAYTSP